ncbi:helix-turn-helix domain-containing protein [Streptomyces canus]|uniref:helix-turn-helix domain-containing protein n=1 Tax=Streptomyces canus TaxID=58343 RepID=UPI0036EF6798
MESERGVFAAELTRWRTDRGLSKKALADRLNVDRSYISHLEAGREHGSPALARRADTELDAGGALWTAWQGTDCSPSAAEQSDSTASTGLLVLEDDAALDFDGSTRLSRFTHGMARLVAHELDHLCGVLYRERMRPGVLPIPVEEYRGTGQQWQYG